MMELLSTFSRVRLRTLNPTEISDELESGRIVFFPECPITSPPEEDLEFLRREMPGCLTKKNVSYHVESGRLHGIRADRPTVDRTRRILAEHLLRVREFLLTSIPSLTEGWTVGTASFRPLQERSRSISTRKSSELIHVDAGAYGATHGDRILRFFVNVHPTEERVWISKGPFEQVYERYRAATGYQPETLRERWRDRLYSGLIVGLRQAGWASARVADSSPYDRVMRRVHNWMKETPEYQRSEGATRVSFPPFSAWMVFTDGLSHACLSGQHAFIDTFLIPLRNCRHPDRSPYHILTH